MSDDTETDIPISGETEPAERLTTKPPPSHGEALDSVPRAPNTGFGLPTELDTIALVGRLVTSLDAYAAEAQADRTRAEEDRVKAELDRRQIRAWFTRYNATQDAQLGLIRGDIQRINLRLEEGDAEFKAHRAELRAKDDRIAELVDCVSAMNIEIQSMRGEQKQAETGVVGTLTGLTLLVLEDSNQMRAAMARVCTNHGARVLQAGTLADAQAIVAAPTKIDVVTVDLKLGSDDAMPFVRELAISHAAGVVIVTGHATDAQVAEARELGVLVLDKPFSIDALLVAIREAARPR